MQTLVISFYSDIEDNTYYSDHGKRLQSECESFGMPYIIEHKESLGTYRDNCLSKPRYILEKLEEYNRPLLWLDVDSRVHKPLDIFDTFGDDVDIAVASSNGQLSGVKASPIFFRNNDKAKSVLYTWMSAIDKIKEDNQPVFDHEPFFGVLHALASSMNIGLVGPEFCIWPGYTNEHTCITMGLTDSETKKENLRKMGLGEDAIEFQSVGNKYDMDS